MTSVPFTFDIIYANERIDYITETSNTMLQLYKELMVQSIPTQEDVKSLADHHKSVTLAISDYYDYLEKTGISAEESYLTKWLDDRYFTEYIEDIEYFLTE